MLKKGRRKPRSLSHRSRGEPFRPRAMGLCLEAARKRGNRSDQQGKIWKCDNEARNTSLNFQTQVPSPFRALPFDRRAVVFVSSHDGSGA